MTGLKQFKLVIEQEMLSCIHAHVIKSFPAEDCGLLSGMAEADRYKIDAIWPAKNLLAHLPGRFELDPSVRIKAEKACRQNGTRVLGHWHSHPFASASPSATDFSFAYEQDLAWLIVSCDREGVIETKSFFPPEEQDGSFREIPLQILQSH